MAVDITNIWNEYDLGGLEQKLSSLFPDRQFHLEDMFSKILSGDIMGGISYGIQSFFGDIAAQFYSIREIFIWIMLLGIAAALIAHFIEIFDNHQIADIGFYFTYLLMSVILMKCFVSSTAVAVGAIRNIVNFTQIFIPVYFLSVGVATGAVTAVAGYQVVILLIYVVENVLLSIILPLINSYVLLALINGLWIEEKLTLLVDGVEKAIRFLLKVSLGVITGFSLLQSMITPAIDSVKATTLQKAVAAIPGIGDAADGVVEVVLGSAVVIKNSIGLVMLILLLVIAAVPLCKILIMSFLLKAAAAFLGVVSDKRITMCTDKVGCGGQLLFKTAGTSLLLFMITVSIAAYTTNRGF